MPRAPLVGQGQNSMPVFLLTMENLFWTLGKKFNCMQRL